MIVTVIVVLAGCKASQERQKTKINSLVKSVTGDFESIISDVKKMAEDEMLKQMLDKKEALDSRQLEQKYLTMVSNRKIYDQARFLNEKGMELVRVNYNNGAPIIVPKELLQNKADRYYFSETSRLDKGQVFVSSFDLNVERGEIEQPPKPTIRFGTSVYDSDGVKRGVVIINYLGAKLLENFERVSVDFEGESMLLNSDGYWLYSPRKVDEFAFMYENKVSRTFKNSHPDAWQQISESQSGQFYTDDGLFTFDTVSPFIQTYSRDHFWKVVSYIPSEKQKNR